MQQLHHFFKQLVLATALILGTSAAVAGPVYTVTLDTAAFDGSANLDLSFGSFAEAAPVTALVSNFSAGFGNVVDSAGAVSGTTASGITMLNAPGYNFVTFALTMGGTFSFNVSFGDGFSGIDNALFAVTLFNESGFLGSDGPVAAFTLTPAVDGPSLVEFSGVTGLASAGPAADVPEPSQLLLMLTALALLGFMARRRSAK